MTAIVLLLSLLLLLLLFWPLLTRLLLVAAFWLSRATCAWQGRLADGVPSTCSQHQAQQQFSSSPPPGFRMTFAGWPFVGFELAHHPPSSARRLALLSADGS